MTEWTALKPCKLGHTCGRYFRRGYIGDCIQCSRESSRKYKDTHLEIILEQKRKHKDVNQDIIRDKERQRRNINLKECLIKGAKHRAKEKGLFFDLKVSDVDWVEVCPILGTPLIYEMKTKTRYDIPQENRPSLDQKIPGLGYFPANVMVVSMRGNSIKSNGSAEAHRRIAELMEKPQW